MHAQIIYKINNFWIILQFVLGGLGNIWTFADWHNKKGSSRWTQPYSLAHHMPLKNQFNRRQWYVCQNRINPDRIRTPDRLLASVTPPSVVCHHRARGARTYTCRSKTSTCIFMRAQSAGQLAVWHKTDETPREKVTEMLKGGCLPN